MAKQQIPTVGNSTEAIMRTPAFARGFNDARKGLPFDWRAGCDQPNASVRDIKNGSWDYERGRLLAFIAPLNMPLRVNGKLNPKAIALFDAAWNRKLII